MSVLNFCCIRLLRLVIYLRYLDGYVAFIPMFSVPLNKLDFRHNFGSTIFFLPFSLVFSSYYELTNRVSLNYVFSLKSAITVKGRLHKSGAPY